MISGGWLGRRGVRRSRGSQWRLPVSQLARVHKTSGNATPYRHTTARAWMLKKNTAYSREKWRSNSWRSCCWCSSSSCCRETPHQGLPCRVWYVGRGHELPVLEVWQTCWFRLPPGVASIIEIFPWFEVDIALVMEIISVQFLWIF